ncbi:MAG: DUF2905 family protein [Anaerolineaceae bacterium]|jgi:phosphotransferase system  glucose/maltose/N-acetylglucosamine-specific IIC component
MFNLDLLARGLIIGGVTLLLLGVIVWLLNKIPGIEQFPGTIRIAGSGFTCIIPVLAAIILSIVLTIVLNVVIRLINK